MKINIKARLKNKAFIAALAALIITFIYQLLAAFGVVPNVTEDAVTEIVEMVLNLLGILGVIVDPTTDGLSDSKRALTYYTEDDVRKDE